MDFTLDETATDLARLASDIVDKTSGPETVAALEAAGAPIDASLWRELGAAGLLGIEVPSTSAGEAGADLGAVENIVIAEVLGARLARVPFGVHAVAAVPILSAHAGAADLTRLLPAVATGEHIVGVAAEEDLGAEWSCPTTCLRPDADSFVLVGSKLNVAYAAAADSLLVTATSPEGPVVLLVDTSADGVRVVDTPSTGLIPIAAVDFDGVSIPRSSVLDGGSGTVARLVDRARLAVCAEQSGVVRRALELTARYAREREQFGRAIGSFQAVAQRLADAYIDAAGLELTTRQAAWTLAAGLPEASEAIATAKFWAAEAGHRVAHTTVHVHGGVGLDTSHPMHRYFLRAKQNEFTLGTVPAVLAEIGDGLAGAAAAEPR